MSTRGRAFAFSAVAATLAVPLPSVLLASAGMTALAPVAFLAALSACFTAMTASPRFAIALVAPLAAGCAIAAAIGANPWIAAGLMAAVAGAQGLLASRGLHTPMASATIAIGYVVALPPRTQGDVPSWIACGAVVLACAAWATAIVVAMRSLLPANLGPAAVEMPVARLYAAVLAGVVAVATWVVVALGLGHAGFWLVLTVIIVLQPYLQDERAKSLQRAGGTLLGFAVVFAIGTVVTAPAAIEAIGSAALLVAVYAMATGRPYWQFVTGLTTAIVLFTGARSNVLAMDLIRLAGTIGGLAIVLGVATVMRPLARRNASRAGLPRY